MKTKCQYNHECCNSIDQQGGAKGGAGCVIIMDSKYILLGFDKYHQSYAICTGKRSQEETCYIEAIERECREEFKLNISSIQLTNSNVFQERNEAFIDENSNTKFIVIGGTPIFIGNYELSEINLATLNKKITQDNNDASLSNDQKEIDHLTIFLKDSLKRDKNGNYKMETIQGFVFSVTKFTHDVINNINSKVDIVSNI
jgi:hypothetical protein